MGHPVHTWCSQLYNPHGPPSSEGNNENFSDNFIAGGTSPFKPSSIAGAENFFSLLQKRFIAQMRQSVRHYDAIGQCRRRANLQKGLREIWGTHGLVHYSACEKSTSIMVRRTPRQPREVAESVLHRL